MSDKSLVEEVAEIYRERSVKDLTKSRQIIALVLDKAIADIDHRYRYSEILTTSSAQPAIQVIENLKGNNQ